MKRRLQGYSNNSAVFTQNITGLIPSIHVLSLPTIMRSSALPGIDQTFRYSPGKRSKNAKIHQNHNVVEQKMLQIIKGIEDFWATPLNDL